MSLNTLIGSTKNLQVCRKCKKIITEHPSSVTGLALELVKDKNPNIPEDQLVFCEPCALELQHIRRTEDRAANVSITIDKSLVASPQTPVTSKLAGPATKIDPVLNENESEELGDSPTSNHPPSELI